MFKILRRTSEVLIDGRIKSAIDYVHELAVENQKDTRILRMDVKNLTDLVAELRSELKRDK